MKNDEEIEILDDETNNKKIDEALLSESNQLLYEYKNLICDIVIFSKYYGSLEDGSKFKEACKTQIEGMHQYREGLEQRIFLMMTGQKD
jgi:hypothetical protein